MSITRRHFIIALTIAILIGVVNQDVLAAIGTQILGRKPVSSVRGNRADITAGTLPTGDYGWVASPVAICTADPCTAGANPGFFETGYYKQPNWAHIRQYSSSQRSGLPANPEFWVDTVDLNEGISYGYKSLYSNSAARWEAWRYTDVPYFRTSLNFTSGNGLACGGEALNSGISVNVTCYNNQYKVGSGAWTSWMFTYQTVAFTPGGYCVKSVGTDDFKAYGPGVQTCP